MDPDQKTEVADQRWRAPVSRRDDLPDRADEGECCYVRDESAVYAHRDGRWVKEVSRIT